VAQPTPEQVERHAASTPIGARGASADSEADKRRIADLERASADSEAENAALRARLAHFEEQAASSPMLRKAFAGNGIYRTECRVQLGDGAGVGPGEEVELTNKQASPIIDQLIPVKQL
jgi:hypothetical protein